MTPAGRSIHKPAIGGQPSAVYFQGGQIITAIKISTKLLGGTLFGAFIAAFAVRWPGIVRA
jgi:hypothetical protein